MVERRGFSCCRCEEALFRKWFKTRTRESWEKYKESRQYANKVVSHAKECKTIVGNLCSLECWLVSRIKRRELT